MHRRRSAESARLREFLDARLGDSVDLVVEPMVGGGSCDVYALTRGDDRWVLRQAPPHRSSATAHDVLREFRFLDAIKDQPVRIARPVLACDDPDVFGGPFYVMERIDGVPVRSSIPEAWTARPERAAARARGARRRARRHPRGRLGGVRARRVRPHRAVPRTPDRALAVAARVVRRPRRCRPRRSVGDWLADDLPPDQAPALAHGDYKLDNVLFAETAPPELLAVVDWEMASIGDPLVDLAWAMIFHPGPGGDHAPRRRRRRRRSTGRALPTAADARRALRRAHRARRRRGIDWYDVFSRWKLAIVLEGSYAKFLRGESKKPVHEYFGQQADQLLASALAMVEATRTDDRARRLRARRRRDRRRRHRDPAGARARRGEHAQRRRPPRRVAHAALHPGGQQGRADRRGGRPPAARPGARRRGRRAVARVRRSAGAGSCATASSARPTAASTSARRASPTWRRRGR